MNFYIKGCGKATVLVIVLFVICYQSFSFPVYSEDKVACPECDFMNNMEDRYCVGCLYEIRPLSKDDLKKIELEDQQKAYVYYDKAKEYFFKAKNSSDEIQAKQNYEYSYLNSQKALRAGKKVFPQRAIEDLKKISWISKQNYSHLLKIIKEPETRVKMRKRGQSYYVEVLLNNKVTASLHLDTGCSISLMSPDVAERLGIRDGKKMYAILADGKKVESKQIMIDSVEVEGEKLKNIPFLVHETTGDGLLGMSFLKYFNFKVDTKKHVLILKRR